MKIEIDGDSPEAVALALLHLVAGAEGRLDDEGRIVGASRAWLLDAYVECLAAVNGARTLGPDDEEEEDDDDDDGDDEESEGDEDECGDEEEENEDEDEDEEREDRAYSAPRRRR